MSDLAKEIIPISIEKELQQSYLDYAMSVIVGRALPDVRDGLKPVHRRTLFGMRELGNFYNKPFKKSARIVGEVIGKYHPHGEGAVYDTIVRMAQPFTLRYLLVNGQGNFGSVDGDEPAAMRYTEIRLSQLAQTFMDDLDKETVDFLPNYDGSEFAPAVLPTRIPNLLINGSSGIAVGMATNVPPHNLTEVIDACLALINKPETSIDELMSFIPGPDFPTAAIINGRGGIVEAYRTGRGRILVRGRTQIEETSSGKQAIIITELPYQVNKARLQEKVGSLVKEKRIEGITAIRDESDREGMRVVIELRRGENAEVIINNLYSQTQLQVVFGINMVALDQGQPRQLNLKQILMAFLSHRQEVVTRRTIYELRKTRERAHILEGLGVALVNIDEMIALIKKAANPAAAKEQLIAVQWPPGLVLKMLETAGTTASRPADLPVEYGLKNNSYSLSPVQAQAILDLRLHRLTGLEQEKIFAEYKELIEQIKILLDILGNPDKLLQVIRDELLSIQKQFGDKRRTEIIDAQEDFTNEDLIAEEDVVVTLSHQGYAKTQTLDSYQAQHRGGRGKSATAVKDEDFISHLLIAKTHDTVLCFSSLGKVYWLKVYQIPQASRISRGRPIVNLLPLEAKEQITAVLPLREYSDQQFIFMATAQGTVKKVSVENFSRPRTNGIIAIDLAENDILVGAVLTTGQQDIMLFSDAGKVIRFQGNKVRTMGRSARGVRGIRLEKDQRVIALVIVHEGSAILTATAQGYGKRTAIEEYRLTGRGAQGVISIQVNERNGKVIAAVAVQDNEEIMLISDQGTLVRIPVEEISVIGRNTQGVRLINLNEDETLVGVQRIHTKVC